MSEQYEFQSRIDETCEGLKGVAGIADDIVVFVKTKEEHDYNLRAMLSQTRERGLRLNSSLTEAMETQIHTVISTASLSVDRLDEIKTATALDKQLSALKHTIQTGWPGMRRKYTA